MADSKIKDLTEKATYYGNDELIINDVENTNVDKKIKLSTIVNAAGGGSFNIGSDKGPNGGNTRDIDTVYQNNTGKSLMLIINIEISAQDSGGGLVYGQTFLNIDSSNPPTTNVQFNQVSLSATSNNQNITSDFIHVFVVNDGDYYELATDTDGDATAIGVVTWYEMELG